jgi:hypothetical protein
MLSQFQRDQLIAVQNRNIEIKSLDGLQQTIGDYRTRRPALDLDIRNIGNSRKSG